MCISVCPQDVIELRGRKAVIRDLDSCMECGACRQNCPVGAVEVEAGVGCAYAVIRGVLTCSAAVRMWRCAQFLLITRAIRSQKKGIVTGSLLSDLASSRSSRMVEVIPIEI